MASTYTYESSNRSHNLSKDLGLVDSTFHADEDSSLLDNMTEIDECFEETDEEDLKENGVKYQSTWYRWVVISFFSLSICLNSLIAIGVAPVAIKLQEAYQLETAFLPNLCDMIFPAVSLGVTPVVICLYQKY